MGYPSTGLEGSYRNSLKTVKEFLNNRHRDGTYKVYNLCLEKDRQYKEGTFQKMVTYGFYDHNPPSFSLLEECMKDISEFLKENNQNVAAIHCKAGKGRTGTIIASLLLYSYYSFT